MSLRVKLLLGVLALLLPVLGLLLWGVRTEYEQLRASVLDQQAQMAATIAVLMDTVLDDTIDLGWSLANNPTLISMIHSPDPNQADLYLQQLAQHYPNYLSIAIVHGNGDVVGSSVPYAPGEPRLNIGESWFFQQAMATGQPVVSEVFASARWPGKSLVVVAVPMLNAGEQRPIGAVNLVFDVGHVPSRLAGVQLRPGEGFSVIDPQGRAAFVSRWPDLGWEERDLSQLPEVQAALAGQTIKSDTFTSPFDQSKRVTAFVRSPGYGWVASFGSPAATVYGPVEAALRRNLAAFALVTILGIAGAWWLSAYLVGPLGQLVVMAHALGRGHLDQRVAISTGDEVEQLGRAFNSMADQLRADRRQIEAERRRLLAVLQHIPTGVIIADAPDGRFSLWNHVAESLLAHVWAGDTLAAWRAVPLHYPDGRPFPFEAWPLVQALEAGQPSLGVEAVLPGPAGGRMVLLVNAAPILDDGGRVVAAAMVFQDITHRKTMEQMKDEFMALVAHELKTPIAAIKGNSQYLLRQVAHGRLGLGEREVQLLRSIDERVNYVTGLLNELLDLSRIATGRLALQPAPMDLAALLRNVVAQHRAQHPGRPLHLEGADQPLPGVWDWGRLEQVFVNLLDNAEKYSPAGRPITVRLARSGHQVEVTLQDQGIGIPRRDLPRLFERHFRGSNVGLTPAGLGLGLYLSSQIVQRHNGRLWAESVEGQGSIFHVVLPVGQAASAA